MFLLHLPIIQTERIIFLAFSDTDFDVVHSLVTPNVCVCVCFMAILSQRLFLDTSLLEVELD